MTSVVAATSRQLALDGAASMATLEVRLERYLEAYLERYGVIPRELNEYDEDPA